MFGHASRDNQLASVVESVRHAIHSTNQICESRLLHFNLIFQLFRVRVCNDVILMQCWYTFQRIRCEELTGNRGPISPRSSKSGRLISYLNSEVKGMPEELPPTSSRYFWKKFKYMLRIMACTCNSVPKTVIRISGTSLRKWNTLATWSPVRGVVTTLLADIMAWMKLMGQDGLRSLTSEDPKVDIWDLYIKRKLQE